MSSIRQLAARRRDSLAVCSQQDRAVGKVDLLHGFQFLISTGGLQPSLELGVQLMLQGVDSAG